MRSVDPTVIAGSTPLVLVAPHGGRRDYHRRPWGSGRLRVNDLHTASLTRELAEASGAAAVINDGIDRNDVDLNRLSAACDRAPAFLERLADCCAAALAAHGRATVLTVHGWNVIQPAVDLGIGCKPGEGPDGRAAVSAAFAARAVPALVRACDERGVAATVGARYPASGRENLIQLFTPRYRDDERPLIRQLAALGQRAQAMQCELSLPLRWPGAWRRRLVEGVLSVLPELLEPDIEAETAQAAMRPSATATVGHRPHRRTLEAVGADRSLLVSTDAAGGRLLLFLPDGGLALFTGERTGGEPAGSVGGLRLDDDPDGALRVRFAGPMMRFPDTTPFLDLERGLGAAHAIEHGTVDLTFSRLHAHGDDGVFGRVTGSAVLDGRPLDLGGDGFAAAGGDPAPWPRVRAALALPGGARLSLLVGLGDAIATGFLCDGLRHRPVTGATAVLGPATDPFDGFGLSVEVAGGERLEVRPRPFHRLPVVRGGGPVPLRLIYASCRVPGVGGLAGWCEIGGI